MISHVLKALLLYFLLPSCASSHSAGSPLSASDTSACPSPITEGVQGTVYAVSGNQMPSPGRKPRPLQGVRSTVYIYDLTPLTLVVREGGTPYYSAIRTRFIKQVDTDSLGHYCTSLPVGKYSVFTKKGDLFYANLFDSANNINPVEVVGGKVSTLDCRIEGKVPPTY